MDPHRMQQVRAVSVQHERTMTLDGKKCPTCKRPHSLRSESNKSFARIHCKWSDCDYVREYSK